MTPFRQYLLTLLLLALLQAPRLTAALEDLVPTFPAGGKAASVLIQAAEASGLPQVDRAIVALLARFSTDKLLGSLPSRHTLETQAHTAALPQATQTASPSPSPADAQVTPAAAVSPPSAPEQDPSSPANPANDSPPSTLPENTPPSPIPAPQKAPLAENDTSSETLPAFRTTVTLIPRIVQTTFTPYPANEAHGIFQTTLLPFPPSATAPVPTAAAQGVTATPPPAHTLSAPLSFATRSSSPALLVTQATFSPSATLSVSLPQGGKLPGDKIRVLFIGDSMMMEGVGPALLSALSGRADLELVRDARYSTGLSRRDYFDWPRHMASLAAHHAPDLVVISMGGNDAQDIVDIAQNRRAVGSPAWEACYLLRARELVVEAVKSGAKVLWIGLPVMGNQPHSQYTLQISAQQRTACSEPYSQLFVDTLPILSDSNGGYLTYAQDRNGMQTRLREKDKIHVTLAGGELVAEVVVPHMNAMAYAIAAERMAALLNAPAPDKRTP